MNEWTEQEEQQIIERAKTGDPEANYALSLWALRRGEEEPDEPRWNRLAAKCLVKAAQAGYGPAKDQLAALLSQDEQTEPAPQTAPPAQFKHLKQPVRDEEDEEEEEEDFEEEEEEEQRQPDVRRAAPVRRQTASARPSAARSSTARPASTARRAAPQRQLRRPPQDDPDEGFDADSASWDDDEDDGAQSARRGLRDLLPGRQNGGRNWGDDKWRRMEFLCVCVCALLLVIIAVMLLTSKRGSDGGGAGGAAIPPAGEATSVDNSGGTVASNYPDDATKSAIMAADLDIQPSPEDYVTEATSGTVSVSSEYLRLRKGPNTTYDPIAQMPNGTTVSVLAKKNDWDLILYQGDDGPVYGWCTSEYLIITAGAVTGATGATGATGTTGTTATDAPGTVEG